jgi:hypothetical protein
VIWPEHHLVSSYGARPAQSLRADIMSDAIYFVGRSPNRRPASSASARSCPASSDFARQNSSGSCCPGGSRHRTCSARSSSLPDRRLAMSGLAMPAGADRERAPLEHVFGAGYMQRACFETRSSLARRNESPSSVNCWGFSVCGAWRRGVSPLCGETPRPTRLTGQDDRNDDLKYHQCNHDVVACFKSH